MYTSGCYGPSWLASIGWRGQCGTPMTISSDANRILLFLFHVIIITIAVMIIIFIIQLTSSWHRTTMSEDVDLKPKLQFNYMTIGQIKTGTQLLYAHNTPSLHLLGFVYHYFLTPSFIRIKQHLHIMKLKVRQTSVVARYMDESAVLGT